MKNLLFRFLEFIWPIKADPEIKIPPPIELLQFDPEIRLVINWLWKKGFSVAKSKGGREPFIAISVLPGKLISETHRLRDLLFLEHEINIHFRKSELNLFFPEIKARYDIAHEMGTIILHNVTNEKLKLYEI